MSSNLTPQQRAAVDHRGSSVVLASGAGCGKTHVLTARYLSHLTADSAEVPQVVAITFTERAAREMRDRIRTAVERLPDPAKHLRDLETAPIATIHSFCGTLLRQFAVPAGLDPGFEVLDDVLSANIRTDALIGCLKGLLTEPEPTPGLADRPGASPGLTGSALRELIVLFGWNAVVEAVDGLLLSADRSDWEAWLVRPPEEIAAEWAGPDRASLLPGWVEYLCAASPKITGCLTLLSGVRSANPQVNVNIRRLLTETPLLHEAGDLPAAVTELTELAKVGRTGKKDWPDEAVYEAVKEAFTEFRTDLPKRFGLFAETPDGITDAARAGQLFLRVAIAADDEYRRRKRRAGVLDFQDLLVFARDLIRDRSEVRDALHGRFRFLLLDELQDTDPIQMELVELLCGAGLEHGKLFAVGDHKQSIYRFRGAEVGLFRNLRQVVAAEGRLGLARNFRSQPGVLRFVNALFSKRVPDYEPLEAHHGSASDGENVEFLWTSTPTPTGKEAGRAAPSASSLRAAEADSIARRIVELLADPTPHLVGTDGTTRRVELRDVVLLFRSMSHVAIYEAALRRHGLDYYLVGGRAFFAQQEVYDLLNLLRTIENPQDGASLVGVLRSPFCGLSDEAVFLVAAHPEGPWAGLRDPDRLATLPADQAPTAERAARFLAKWRSVKDKLTIARLLNTVFADSGYDAAMQFEFLGDRKLANLWKLIDLARSFDRTGLFGLPEFTARLADLIARQPREEQAATLPETADVVKLMSIHQAKGLEFPVVIVPDLAAPTRGDFHPVARWHRGLGCLVRLPAEFEDLPDGELPPFADFADRLGRTADQLADWQEDLRVLYVACTRARDRLILSAAVPVSVGNEAPEIALPSNHWTLALREQFDLRTGRCIADNVKPDAVPQVRVTVVNGGRVPESRGHGSAVKGQEPPTPAATASPTPDSRCPMPGVVALPALERLARGEHVRTLGEQFDTEDDSDHSHWRHPRERLGPVTPAEAALWSVLERWDFADVDGWAQLLADATEDDRTAANLRPKLRTFAESEARFGLAVALDAHRSVEFLADLTAFAALDSHSFTVHGVIDFLFQNAGGWHVLAVDLGTADEDDPWRGRRPGLVLQAWAVRQQLGEWPTSIQLFDLATGQLVRADPRKFKPAPIAERFATLVAAWRRTTTPHGAAEDPISERRDCFPGSNPI